MRLPRAVALIVACLAFAPVLFAAAPSIDWAGGPIIESPRIVVIYWGTPTASFRASMDRFYDQIARSTYLTPLFEYSTGAIAKPPLPTAFRRWFGFREEQVIGNASFAGSYVIKRGEGGNVETTDIGATLDHEIHVGHIPAPDRNTIYAVHFSPTWELYLGTNILGIPVGAKTGEGFCAYHAAYYSHFTSRAMVYTAVPNQARVPRCRSSRALDAETFSASHELIEAITDPGSAVVEGAFLSVGISSVDQAWRAPNGFMGLAPTEVADVCETPKLLRTSPDARDIYLVSQMWKRSVSTCVLAAPMGSLDAITPDGTGRLHARGWGLDPAVQITTQVHLYIDGPYPHGRGFAVLANLPRPDVNVGTGFSGAHGFDFVVPPEYMDGRTHTVYAYGIGRDYGNNAFLGNVPLTFNSADPTAASPQPVMIASAKAPNQCLDVTGYSRAPGTVVQTYTCHGGENQRFLYHPDTQAITVYDDPGLCLDASGGAGRNGDRLIVWPCHGEANQRWSFSLMTGEIRGVANKCMDGTNSSVDNGTAVQIWTCNGGRHQSWFRK